MVLVHPEIPWNTGNAGRTCVAAGARLHLVRPLGFDLSARRVRRAGLDYWEHVRPVVHESLEAFERALPDLGEPLLFDAAAPRDFFDAALPARPVLIFGREGDGLPPELRERYREQSVRLPMRDARVRSLNVSTAVGIAVYETLRRATPR